MPLRRLLLLVRQIQHQRWAAGRLRQHQDNRLIEIVRHAYHRVPYYRSAFDKAGLDPFCISGSADLHCIPITRKEDLVNLEPTHVIAPNFSLARLKCHRTGGTTGLPLNIFSSPYAEDLRISSLFATFLANGYRPHQKIALLQASAPRPSVLNRLGLFKRIDIPYRLPIEEQLALLRNIQAPVLEGYPSRIGHIAHEVLNRGLSGIRPKLIITNSEGLTPNLRQKIQWAFGVDPINVYDAWEFGNIAWECPCHDGLHINADRLLVETIDSGRASKSAPGEVVITDLYNEAMPLIRYAIGDMAVISDKPCRCGRVLPLIKDIIGRSADQIQLADGTHLMATLPINALLKDVKGIREYQVVQNKIGELRIAVVADSSFTLAQERHIKNAIESAFKLNCVKIRKVSTIQKTPAFKHRFFISEIVP